MVDFTNGDLFILEQLCVKQISLLECTYRRNVNSSPVYAAFVGELATKYFRLLLKIHPGFDFFTESDSFRSYLCA